MLDKKEYEILNKTIKDIYRIKTSREMRRTVLKDLKGIIPFKMAVFSLGVRKNKNLYPVDCVVVSDFEKNFEDQFIYLSESCYSASDYASWIFQIPETVVYRDSDVVNGELKKKTRYYKDYLLPNDLPYLAGISIVHNEEFLGALTLYKSQKGGDFTEKDLFVLNFLVQHLEARLAEDEEHTVANRKNVYYILKSDYNMTSREIEIMGWAFQGKNNEEIADILKISIYTVKKHLSNIYEKLEISSRSQLVQFVMDAGITEMWVE